VVVEKFFQHLAALKERANSKTSKRPNVESVAIELAFNRPVVDRVLRLINSSESYNENVNRLWRPITDFLALVNRFLIDCDKEICIDKVGWLNVVLKGGEPLSLDVLSSGERQIVVILGHLAISRELNQERIFIVDEPELSLHLKWQQIFVESIIAANQNSQFVLATHSPAIVMSLREKCVSLDRNSI
ncbi:MAG TPA: AAA family ATPase, partial [Rhodocyclaceae bacterium]|nr:AAA family ATPase [Rhodocyclaceae bacterium]